MYEFCVEFEISMGGRKADESPGWSFAISSCFVAWSNAVVIIQKVK